MKAFGAETFSEEKTYNVTLSNANYGFGNNFSYHNWNAWTMANSANGNKDWTTSRTLVSGVQPMYTTAAKACMSRNRDLNGDGNINQNEIRWYLAAVDQYRALFFGKDVLNDADAFLINRDALDEINTAFVNRNNGSGWGSEADRGNSYRSRYHYYTSSGGNQAVFWPEEGLTNNPMDDGWSKAVMVRCVRTLSSGGNGLEDPERFYTYDATTNTVTLGGIVATRGRTNTPLPRHNEIEGSNNLYSSFVIARSNLNGTHRMENVTGQGDVCSNYTEGDYIWRTPNQKELALMVMVSSQDTDGLVMSAKYGSRTRFSGSDYDRDNRFWRWHSTHGFWTTNQSINVGGEGGTDGLNVTVQVRCVRDGE